MKKLLFGVALLGLLALATTASAATREDPSGPGVTLGVYGDSPYGIEPNTALGVLPRVPALDRVAFLRTPAFIDAVNADPAVGLVLHVGDIHSGSEHCYANPSDNPYAGVSDQGIFNLWTAYQDPVVYTPGDNEWTDCTKKKENTPATSYYDAAQAGHIAGDPLDNLALVRRTFFANPGFTLGQNARHVVSQGLVDPRYSAYVENVMWTQAGVLFVTVNLPGSNNDLVPWYGGYPNAPNPRQIAESADRTAADESWLATAFALAGQRHLKGVLIGAQADMWDPAALPKNPGDGLDGYDGFVQELAALTRDFKKPVLLINGDSHVYETDRPLSAAFYASSTTVGDVHHVGFTVDNFQRITVRGSTNAPANWYLRLNVDPGTSQVFSWESVDLALP
jgi:hypothetical protein